MGSYSRILTVSPSLTLTAADAVSVRMLVDPAFVKGDHGECGKCTPKQGSRAKTPAWFRGRGRGKGLSSFKVCPFS